MGQSSSLYLTEQLIAFIYKTLKKRTKNISIVLIGRDTNFLNMVKGIEELPIYISEIRNRGVELNFAISNCNSLLITASTSKEAWWIGYLMPEGSPIYYNNCLGIDCKIIFKKDYFPPEWLPLTTDYQGNIILDDNPFE
uniref:Uncharacterized protein n=1 Tax=Meloidogyne incognita TaxID=6306 RepID=A0A914KKE1_MELIC